MGFPSDPTTIFLPFSSLNFNALSFIDAMLITSAMTLINSDGSAELSRELRSNEPSVIDGVGHVKLLLFVKMDLAVILLVVRVPGT